MRVRLLAGFGLLSLSVCSSSEAETLRIANWNMANHPNDATDQANLRTVFAYAGSAKPIDLLAMVETDTDSGPITASLAGSVFGGTYASLMTAPDGGGDRTGFVYNTSTLSLISQTTVGGITHPSLRAEFRPSGTSGDEDFYVYATHLQSGSTSTIKNQRVSQATVLRADADTLGSANVIFGGDFNWQKADDVSAGVGAYRTFNAAGAGQVTDAANMVGNWHANAAYQGVMTNDPGKNLDDRFDMQLISGELTDGLGLDYVSGSYSVVGNDGTVPVGGTLASAATVPSTVTSALMAFSDHLPVLADYSYSLGDPVALYFTGRTSNSLNVAGNYTTTLAGTTASTTTPGSGTDVYLAASNAVAGNLNATLASNLSVNILTIGTGAAATNTASISGSGTLTINASNGTGISKLAGTATASISTPVALTASQRWINSSGTALTVSGPIALSANTLTLEGPGPTTLSGVFSGTGGLTSSGTNTISGANTYIGVTTVTGGTLRALRPAYSNIVKNSGGLDLQAGRFVFDYAEGTSPVDSIKSILTTDYASNFAKGRIRSSTLAANRTLGYGDNGSVLTLMVTLPGDADLSGSVDFNDFLSLQNNFGKADTSFDQGNFNYDGLTDFNDFLVLQNYFGQSLNGSSVALTSEQVAALRAFGAVSIVPEPIISPVLVLGAAGFLHRRRTT